MIPLRDNIPSSTTPVVNYLIIITCVLVFFLQLHSPTRLQEFYFNPHYLVSPAAWKELGAGFIIFTIFAAMFMHGGVLHIAGNMLFLWIFGDNVEDRMGHLRYLLFYLICGVIAALSFAVLSLFTNVPMLGASGAIAGVLGAYFVLFRRAMVRTLVFLFIIVTIINIPAVIFLGLWFVLQLFSAVGSTAGAGAGIAFWAHVGGFIAGLVLVKRFAVMRRRPPRPRIIDMRSI